jgi:hypothetical protein
MGCVGKVAGIDSLCDRMEEAIPAASPINDL